MYVRKMLGEVNKPRHLWQVINKRRVNLYIIYVTADRAYIRHANIIFIVGPCLSYVIYLRFHV